MLDLLKTPKGVATAGIGIVFAISIWESGWHIIHVASHYGQEPHLAYPLPVTIDMFAFFCAIKLRAGVSKIQKILNRLGMWLMLAISLWFNIESALIDSSSLVGWPLIKAVGISAVPAIIVALAAEILTHTRKAPATTKARSKAPAKAPSTATKPATATKASPRTRRNSITSTATTDPIPAV